MTMKKHLLSRLETAQVAKLKAETELTKEQTKQVKFATRKAKLEFLLRWTMMALVLGGVVKLDVLKGVAAWLTG
ncbi:hypothetical protein V6259_12925 [Marinomonas sp. TI.3.20]|uniref:hypothetical protein n=1 Tax=Marinomonas sp. TI.3.20 TaxID=3121296 RepID=UPI00312022E3